VVLFCRETEGGIEVEFLDWGESIPSDQFPLPVSSQSLRPGGLGVHIMKTCMDQVEYKLIRSGGNRLLLTKLRDETDPNLAAAEAAAKEHRLTSQETCTEKGGIA